MKTIKKLVIATLMVMSLVSCTNEPAPISELSSPNETIITENIVEENIIVEDIITNEDMIRKDYENGKISKEFYEECLYNSRKNNFE